MLLRRKPENWDVVLNFLCLPKSTISAFGDVLEKEILYISFWEGKFFLEIAQNWTKFFTYANLDFPSFPSCLQTELFLGRDGWFGLVLYSAISSRALPVVFGKSRDLLYCVCRRGWIWKHKCWIHFIPAMYIEGVVEKLIISCSHLEIVITRFSFHVFVVYRVECTFLGGSSIVFS